MEELALHILDVAENSVAASASLVEVRVIEDGSADLLTIEILDDGNGMSPETLGKAADPLFTTKQGHRTGLGIPMFAQAAREADGRLDIESRPEGGTRILATFRHSHVDRMPLGDLRGTMAVLICAHPEIDFVCEQLRDGRSVYRADTRRAARPVPSGADD